MNYSIKLKEIVAKLRAPGGCPWDREQTHDSLKPYLLEETFEVLEALNEKKPDKIREELGDLLLQVYLHAQIAQENGDFRIEEVYDILSEKLIRRHPHVFGDVTARTSEEVLINWDKIKRQEKRESTQNNGNNGNNAKEAKLSETENLEADDKKNEWLPLADLPVTLSSLLRSTKAGKRASKLKFDWENSKQVREKVLEELDELDQESDAEKISEEFGDLLFTLSQWARHKKIDPETALHKANHKFEKRFHRMLELYRRNSGSKHIESFMELDMETKENYWQESKQSLKTSE